jgi:hypothetical protein
VCNDLLQPHFAVPDNVGTWEIQGEKQAFTLEWLSPQAFLAWASTIKRLIANKDKKSEKKSLPLTLP